MKNKYFKFYTKLMLSCSLMINSSYGMEVNKIVTDDKFIQETQDLEGIDLKKYEGTISWKAFKDLYDKAIQGDHQARKEFICRNHWQFNATSSYGLYNESTYNLFDPQKLYNINEINYDYMNIETLLSVYLINDKEKLPDTFTQKLFTFANTNINPKEYDPRILFMLGHMYKMGFGVGIDYTKAMEYLTLSADKGNVGSLRYLAFMYQYGQGTEINLDLYIKNMKLAAEKGLGFAQYNLGSSYYTGNGVPSDYQMAFKYYQLAADQGNADAQFSIGDMYNKGLGVSQDSKEAFKYYELAAEQGDAYAQAQIAYMYHYGVGVQQDNAQAGHYYTLAANQGNEYAQKGLESLYKETFQYYKLSADQGNADADTHLQIGAMYINGLGIEKNCELASHHLKLAADQGVLEAQRILGLFYLKGEGVPQDYKKAHHYIKLVADNGNVEAQMQLGKMYLIGNGVEQDYGIAFKYFSNIEEIENMEAKFYLSLMHAKGLGIDKNRDIATKYLHDYLKTKIELADEEFKKFVNQAAPALWNSRDEIDRSRIIASMTNGESSSETKDISNKDEAPVYVRRHIFTDNTGRKFTDDENTLMEDISKHTNLQVYKFRENDEDSETIVFQVNPGNEKTLYYYNEKDKKAIPLDKGNYQFPKVETCNLSHIYWSGVTQGTQELHESKQIFEFSKEMGISKQIKLPHPLCMLNKVTKDYAFLTVCHEGGIKGAGIYYCFFDQDSLKESKEWNWNLLVEELDPDRAHFFGLSETSFNKKDFLFLQKTNEKNQSTLNEVKIEEDEKGIKSINLVPLYTNDQISPMGIDVCTLYEQNYFIVSYISDGKMIQVPINNSKNIYYPILGLILKNIFNCEENTEITQGIYSKKDYLGIGGFKALPDGKTEYKTISDRVPMLTLTGAFTTNTPTPNDEEPLDKGGSKDEKTPELDKAAASLLKLGKATKYFVNHQHQAIPSHGNDPEFGCLVWKPLSTATKPPAIMVPHGGPHIDETCKFDPQIQFLVNRGYVVISPIFSGSTNDLQTSVNGRGELSGRTQREIVRAAQYFSEQGDIDPNRVGICGASFGGYVTFYQATHGAELKKFFPEGFKCGLSWNGMSDLLFNQKHYQTIIMNKLGTPDQLLCYEPLIKDPFQPFSEEAIASLKEKSPLSNAKDVQIPLLILQSERDQKVHQYHGDALSNALFEAKKEHTYGIFKEEGHNLSKSENVEAYFAITENFFAQHLGGYAEPFGDSLSKSTLEFVRGKDLIVPVVEEGKETK